MRNPLKLKYNCKKKFAFGDPQNYPIFSAVNPNYPIFLEGTPHPPGGVTKVRTPKNQKPHFWTFQNIFFPQLFFIFQQKNTLLSEKLFRRLT